MIGLCVWKVLSTPIPLDIFLTIKEEPKPLFFIDNLFTNFINLSGDRRFAEDEAVLAGFADFEGRAKFDSWNKLQGKSMEDAQNEYIALVEQLEKEDTE